MSTISALIGAVVALLGLMLAKEWHFTRLKAKVTSLEDLLKQGDVDRAVEEARKALEEAEKDEQ